ncbi:uncharacterized protein LOC144424324 [Styela clava]
MDDKLYCKTGDIKQIFRQMQDWGSKKSPSEMHQYAVLYVRSESDEDCMKYAESQSGWFDAKENRIYTVHAEALLVGNPKRPQDALKVPFDDSELGKLIKNNGCIPDSVLIYSNHEPCKWCKKAIAKAKHHFNLTDNIKVGYRIERNDLTKGSYGDGVEHFHLR